MPRSRTRRRTPASDHSEWTPRHLARLKREVQRRLVVFTQSLEFRRGLASAQQKTPGLATGGSAWNDDDED